MGTNKGERRVRGRGLGSRDGEGKYGERGEGWQGGVRGLRMVRGVGKKA